ncbi:hypothetical protein EJ08DRAFT_188151 [Tothia fuscella]|uniref:Uncharacterized protein n=1 Tax=Tothia fuscella TaxID=1048955 RepID=A0A9P4NTJ1_9PEZI|nr:hypothetical protein EJ08DRAFT_188151 [Tothia fuscella]
MPTTTEILSTQSAIVPASGGVEGHIPTGVRSGMTGRLVNNCPYDVYAWTDADPAACGGFCSSPVVKVSANGGSYTAAYKPVMQQGGTTMKVQLVPGPKSLGALNGQPPIYQVEYAVSNNQVHTGLLWYNLSPVDGSPFDGKHRSLQGPGSCHKLECDDGQDYHDCDWWADPTQANREMNVEVCDTGVDLRTPQEIVAVLC